MGLIDGITALILRAVLFFGIFLSSFSFAYPCSIQMPLPHEAYSSFKKFTGEGHFIAVVKAQRKPKIKKKTNSQFHLKFETNNLWSNHWLLELEMIENLSGAGPYFSHFQKMSKRYSSTFLDTETSYMNTEKGFDFWDKFDLSSPYMKDYQLGMGCNFPYPILRENHYYVAFGKSLEGLEDNSTVNLPLHFEPIKNLSDPFVDQLRHAVSGARTSPLIISAQKYFQNFKGYAEIEIESCNSDSSEYGLSLRVQNYKRTTPLTADIIEDFRIDTDDIYVADLNRYFLPSEAKNHPSYKCNIGDRLLVIHRPVPQNPRHEYGIMKDRNIYLQYRYLPINNNEIKTSDILTNFDIQDNASLAVEDVKNWIKSGENRDH